MTPKDLTAQIRDAERQMLKRQRKAGIRTKTLVQKIHRQMTAPASLLLAVGMGFILGELTKQAPAPKFCRTADQPQAAKKTPLKTALSLVALVRSLYAFLPLAWMLSSRQQRTTRRVESPTDTVKRQRFKMKWRHLLNEKTCRKRAE